MPDVVAQATTLGDLLDQAVRMLAEGDTAILATVIGGPEAAGITLGVRLLIQTDGRIVGTTGQALVDRQIAEEASKLLGSFDPKLLQIQLADLDTAERLSVYCEILQPQ